VPPSAPVRPAPATGRYRAPGALPTGHLPFTPGAKRVLERSLREALARHDRHVGVEHLALSLITVNNGPVPPILSALGTSAPTVQAAILDCYRQAS
jgi:ATP-dependent Clp protease ATP-binding subunit ClpA